MSKELDIDNNIDVWLPAYRTIMQGKKAICPRCGGTVEANANVYGNNIGYLLITCKRCNKSGYFSRVDFTNFKGIL